MLKLAIVDDDEWLAKQLKNELLGFREIDFVLSFVDGEKFIQELNRMHPEKRPEIILMDVSMKHAMSGVEVTREVKMLFPEIEIVMFTISEDDQIIFDSLKAGAVGYLLKNEPPKFILKTLIDVKNGGTQMSPGVARKAISFLQARNKKVEDGEELSERETQLLQLVSNGMTYDKAADKLSISVNTVKTHMSNIFKKLHVTNKVQALRKIGGL